MLRCPPLLCQFIVCFGVAAMTDLTGTAQGARMYFSLFPRVPAHRGEAALSMVVEAVLHHSRPGSREQGRR